MAIKKPDSIITRTTGALVTVRLPSGQDLTARIRSGDKTAEVVTQTAARLDATTAIAWAAYYEAVANTLDALNAPEPVPVSPRPVP